MKRIFYGKMENFFDNNQINIFFGAKRTNKKLIFS